MILTSTLLPAAIALGAVLPVQETASKDASVTPALQRALDTISADEIKADLMFVASDEMAGRDSPSPQLKVATRFIRSRLMRFGFGGTPVRFGFLRWRFAVRSVFGLHLLFVK